MDSSVFKARQGELEAVVARCSAGKPLIVVVPRSVKGMQTQGGLASWHNVEQVVGALSSWQGGLLLTTRRRCPRGDEADDERDDLMKLLSMTTHPFFSSRS
jgi:hypothetical protein